MAASSLGVSTEEHRKRVYKALSWVVQEPAAFVGGIVAGLLGLNLSEDPLRNWLERTAASARVNKYKSPNLLV